MILDLKSFGDALVEAFCIEIRRFVGDVGLEVGGFLLGKKIPLGAASRKSEEGLSEIMLIALRFYIPGKYPLPKTILHFPLFAF